MTKHIHATDIPEQQGALENFTGTTHIQYVTKAGSGSSMVGRVTFEKGSRTVWHKHSGEQVLYFLEGLGRVQLRGQEIVNVDPGDVVYIPANTEHWHGAHPDEQNKMCHLAITYGDVTWLEPVSEEVYQS